MPKRKYSSIGSRWAAAKAASKKRRIAKRSMIRRTPFQNKTTTVVVPRGPIAPRTIVKLKYHENWVSDGTTFDYVWMLNSLYDPNNTGTGHQPLGFDQYATFYNRYRVFKVKYVLISCTPNAGETWQVSVLADNNNATYGSPNLVSESPTAVSKIVTNSVPARFRGSWNLPRVNGSTPQQYKSDDRFQATFSASPTEAICMHVVHSNVGNGGAPAASHVTHSLTLVFYAELFDPKQLAQS